MNAPKIKVQEIEVKDYLTKSNLPTCDYVINPYIGCPHGCRYCYACFMKRFTNHSEEWGTFIDIKRCRRPVSEKRLQGKSVFLSSVTDCYNEYEAKYCITQGILEQLKDMDCEVGISTKSGLICRDIGLLKQFKNLKVSISMNTLDEAFKDAMDRADRIETRLAALKELHDNGIYTVLFLSPMFPGITDFKEIIECSRLFVDEYWFENLNLRGSYKHVILDYIGREYPQLRGLYAEIYQDGRRGYWDRLAEEIEDYCAQHSVRHINYFYHEELVREKLDKKSVKRHVT